MEIKLSVIIPAYNSEKHLEACLRAAVASLKDDMELIVVDDASMDHTALITTKYSACQLVRLYGRGGAGKARNEGAKKARGKFLLFLDSDVIVDAETYEGLLAIFDKRPEISSVSAIYSHQAFAPGLFQSFKAIEETYKYQAYDSDRYNSFDPHCVCIRRDVFFELGGFTEAYRGAEVEDVEFGYRLSKDYINCIEPNISVRHIYSSFRKAWWNYCRRTFHWMRLFMKSKRFDQAVTTKANAYSVFLASGVFVSAVSVFVWKPFLVVYLFLVTAFVLWNIRFFYLALVYEKRGALKCLPFMLFMLSLQWGVAFGALAGLVYWKFFPQKASSLESFPGATLDCKGGSRAAPTLDSNEKQVLMS